MNEEAEEEETIEETAEEAEEVTEVEKTEETEKAAEKTEEITVVVEAEMVGENEMKLTATVHAPEGSKVSFQWQVSEDDGENYSDIEDATASVLLVELTENDIGNLWRVRVDAA